MTSDKSGDHATNPYLSTIDRRLTAKGMGLFVLINACVEVMKGEISIRTSNLYMTVRNPKQNELRKFPECSLVSKIHILPDNVPSFLGNLICARIPTVDSR